MADSKKMSMSYAGQARADRHQDVKTRVFDPNLVLLPNEYVPDSITHGATEIVFDFKPDPSRATERAILTYRDNGDGNADVKRMTSPSTENGLGVSMYARGHTFVRNRLDDGTFPFVIESKRAERNSVHMMLLGPIRDDGMTVVSPLPEVGDSETSFKTKGESGYTEKIGVLYDRFPKANTPSLSFFTGSGRPSIAPTHARMGDAHFWKNIRDGIEENLLVRLPSDVLSNVKIQIKTEDIDGTVVQTTVCKDTLIDDDLVETTVDKDTFIDVLRKSEHVVLLKHINRDMKDYDANEEYFFIKRRVKALAPFDETLASEFPHYMLGNCALFALEGNVIGDMTLSDAYNVPEDQSAHANRVVYVNFVRKESTTDMNLLPTPATIKVGFIGAVYDNYLDVFRKNKPVELTSRKVKKEIQNSYEEDDDAIIPPQPSSIFGAGSGDSVAPEIQVPVIPPDAAAPPAGYMSLELPPWISKMIGTASNLTSTYDPGTGRHLFTYKRAIHDIDRDTIALALAINEFRRSNTVEIRNIDIVWHIAESNEHRISEKLRKHTEDHSVLHCVSLRRSA
jgi:hypothetical protein